LDDNVKDSLYQSVEKLKDCARGSFTKKDNLHLTVNFIGETNQLKEVKQAMDEALEPVNAAEFQLFLHGFGRFQRKEGDIYWIGVEQDNTLWRLQKELVKKLRDAGFYDMDDREYRPHLTLGRRIQIRENFILEDFEKQIVPCRMEVKKISLMKSEQIRGELVYTEIYHIDMKAV
jgi:2''-5'' RNA ligase